MNVRELHEATKHYLSCGNGEDLVVIRTDGIGGPHSKVTGLYDGIDWYGGKAIIGTEHNLNKIDGRKYSFYREQYLLKNSNLKKVREDRTLRGVFKKKVQPEDPTLEAGQYRKVSPEMWLWLQLDEDYQKKH